MDYPEMNLGSWSTYLTRFKNLMRPEDASPVGETDENTEAARNDDAARTALSTIASVLPNLVFEGYTRWYDYDDEWVLRNLGHVLSAGEEDEILGQLDRGTPEALRELLGYIADQRLGAWQNAAREEFAGDSTPEILKGAANTANWEASRTPGTYYYTYSGDRYLYCDLPEAPLSEWETLPVREQLATGNAQPWGNSGWFYTPTGEPQLYGGAFVYAVDREGPWMTEDQASAKLALSRTVSRRYNPVQPVSGQAGWVQGYDTKEGVWKFTRVSGEGAPGDEAPWTAVNAFRAGDTEYFAGPGYSETGWMPYPAALQGGPATAEVPGDDGEYEDELSEQEISSAMAELLSQNPEFAEIPEDRRHELILEAFSELVGSEQ
ncbi:MAG TPA: hypothetical protein VGI74_19845 [Streptosporangiaceae bacterium]